MEDGVKDKSYAFAIRIVKLYKFLTTDKREFVLSKQLLRSGTAIGALVKEAEHAQSKADFLNKMNIALKEANETEYWLILLRDTDYISQDEFASINKDSVTVLKMLISIVRTTKASLSK
jgi:four helix bundle protein